MSSSPFARSGLRRAAVLFLGFMGVWVLLPRPHAGPAYPGSLPAGARILEDSEMRDVVGGFTTPKAKRQCDSCLVNPTRGMSGASGTMGPRLEPNTGNLHEMVNGPTVPATGGGVKLNFSYDSDLADGANTPLRLSMGYGWQHSYDNSLLTSGLDMLWIRGDGTISFFKNMRSSFKGMADEFARLVRAGANAYQLTTTNGTVYRFSGAVSGPWPGTRYPLRTITDRDGRITTLTYDAQNRLTRVQDPFGNALTFTYDGASHLSTVTDPLSRVTTLSYDTGNNLTSLNRPDGTVITYQYNTLRQITKKTVSGTTAEDYAVTYNSAYRVSRVTDHNGATVYQATSSNNWAVNTTQSLSAGEMRYTPGTSTVTDGLGNQWKYTYDARGFITQVDAPLVGGQPAITRYQYDPATLQVSTVIDPLGRVTQYQYDSRGNRTRITDPLGEVSQMHFAHPTIPSLMTSKIEPDTDVWTWTYDANGNRLSEIDPLGQITSYAYDGQGRMVSTTDGNGHTTTYAYDALSRVATETVDPGGLGITTQHAYDAAGNVIQTTDPRGYQTTYQYDALDRLTRQTRDPGGLGITTRYQYDSRGNRTAVVDPRGNTTSYAYDARDRMTQTTDPAGSITTYTYDANNSPVSATDPLGRVTAYTYDARDRLTQKVEDAGAGSHVNRTTQYSYDAADNLIRQTQPVDAGDGPPRVTQYAYDSLNRKVTETVGPGGLNLTTQYDYAPSGGGCGCNGTPGTTLLHQVTDPLGKVTYYYYDKLDRLVTEARKVNDTADNQGDADDMITRYTYDPVGNQLSTRVENAPDPSLITQYTYDAANRAVQRTVDPGGATLTTGYTYDPIGNVVQTTSPNGNTTTVVYDAVNRMVQVSDTTGTVTTTVYDDADNVLSGTDGNGNGNTTPNVYDGLNRLITQYDALNQPTVYAYDPLSNQTSMTDRNSNTTTYAYDGLNRRIQTVTAAGDLELTTRTFYDDIGNVRRFETANPSANAGAQTQTTEYIYDAANRRTREMYPDDENARRRQRDYTYDAAGNLISRIDQNLDTTSYTYDDLHRLVRRDYTLDPSSPSYPAVQKPPSYTYDRAGHLLSATQQYDPPGSDVILQMTYDGAGRRTQTTQDGRVIQYAYTVDALNNSREVTYPSDRIVREDYDLRNRLATLSNKLPGPVLNPLADWSYDAGNRMTGMLLGNGNQVTQSYNANNWITRTRHLTGVTAFLDFEYGYDNVGNPLFARSHHAPDFSERYRYDSANRLTLFERGTLLPDNSDIAAFESTLANLTQLQAWSLDEVGNWNLTQTRRNLADLCDLRVADKANEYAQRTPDGTCPTGSGAPLAFAYDDNGNLTADPAAGPGASGLTYQYDAEDRLTRVVRDSDGMEIGRYYYDGLSRRVRSDVSNSGALDGTTVFVLDDKWRTVAEYDGLGNLLREYTYDRQINEPVTLDRNLDGDATAIDSVNDERLYYHRGRLDSTSGLSGAAGSLQEAYLYDPYGSTTFLTGAGGDLSWFTGDDAVAGQSARQNRVAFTGHVLDAETCLMYDRARYYSPDLGAFQGRDPAGYVDGFNLYSYVGNRATVLEDLFGLKGKRKNPVAVIVSFRDDFVTGAAALWHTDTGIRRPDWFSVDTDGGVKEAVDGILRKLTDTECIKSLEVTGHGYGGGWVNRLDVGDLDATQNHPNRLALAKLADLWCDENEGITMRMCETARGDEGKKFLAALAKTVKAKVKGWDDIYEIRPTGAEFTASPDGTIAQTGHTGRRSIMRMYQNMNTAEIILTSPGSAVMWGMRIIGF